MRKISLFLAAILAVSTLDVSAAGGSTKVTLYSPYGMNGLKSDFVAVSTRRGSCDSQSLQSDRPDAFRCEAGNSGYPLCFSDKFVGERVACPESAFGKRVDVIVLTAPLPKHYGNTNTNPWVLRLSNGKTCSFVTGATGTVAGMRLNYGCTGGGWVLGDPDQSSQPWRVYFAKDADSGNYEQIAVAEAVE